MPLLEIERSSLSGNRSRKPDARLPHRSVRRHLSADRVQQGPIIWSAMSFLSPPPMDNGVEDVVAFSHARLPGVAAQAARWSGTKRSARASSSAEKILVRTDPKGSGEVSEPGDGTRKVWPRACDPQGAEINLPPRKSRRLSSCTTFSRR